MKFISSETNLFINRQLELKSLNDKWKENKAQLVIIYGKRRVGKTELIKQFIKDKPAVYFLADKRSQKEQLKELGALIGEKFDDLILKNRGFSDWPEVFIYLKKRQKGKFILAIDEYPYLVDVDSSVSSLFQKGWDEFLKNTKIFLILSGSSISMMESEALLYKAPLFGRRTGQIFLSPLSFKNSWQFFPKKSFSEFLKIYTVTGGMPAYLLQFKSEPSFLENIKNKVFNKTEFLYDEVEFMLKEELREPKNYLSLLKAISFGSNKFSDIVNETGLKRNIIHKYLGVLENLKIIEKEILVTEIERGKTKRGVYKVSDNFVRFWFQFIFPYKSDLEINRLERVINELNVKLPILEAATYERVCQEIFWEQKEKILEVEKVGRFWEKDKEIDLVGINFQKKEIIFGEAKWSEKLVGINIYDDLKNKASFVFWEKGRRKEHYILFSKSGFTKEMEILAKKEGVFLIHQDKLIE